MEGPCHDTQGTDVPVPVAGNLQVCVSNEPKIIEIGSEMKEIWSKTMIELVLLQLKLVNFEKNAIKNWNKSVKSQK